jgi:hypothetical protein
MGKAKLIRVRSSGDGRVHIEPCGSHDPGATLCYDVDTHQTYTPTNDKVTCVSCQHEFDSLKDGLRLVRV